MRACHRHFCSSISASSFFQHHRRHFRPERCQAVWAWCASLGAIQVGCRQMILADSRDNHSCNISVTLRIRSSTQHLGASATCEQFDKHVADVPALDRLQMMYEQLQTPACHHCWAVCCRSYFPESVWSQIDKLFPRGSQPVAYDIAIGTGRGAIELAKRQDICHLSLWSSSHMRMSGDHQSTALLRPSTLMISCLCKTKTSINLPHPALDHAGSFESQQSKAMQLCLPRHTHKHWSAV